MAVVTKATAAFEFERKAGKAEVHGVLFDSKTRGIAQLWQGWLWIGTLSICQQV